MGYICRLSNGLRAVVVQDQEAVFAAACVNVQAGYFDDPEDLMGLSHFLEHAVHLVRVSLHSSAHNSQYLFT